MQAMGLSPIERLVLPRIFGILIALPLLVVWADIFGILGSMVMSKNMLNISFYAFMDRFAYAVELKQYVLGLFKAPFFAMIISGVGCFQGFQVELSAESVGVKTTRAAVQAIFLIIIADAAFSIIFNELGY
jgi:phospholipid/cholesterol/gamma-HCH transport system permease protein